MKRHGRVLAVLTALILTANLAFTCYAQENSDGSSESTGEKSNETITITGGIETRDPQEDPGEADETEVTEEPQAAPADGDVPEGTSDAFLAVPASEEVASNDLPLILEGNTLYTYGVPVVIKKDDSDQKAYIYDGSGNEKLIATPVGSLTIYGGGDASKGGSAKAGSIHIALDDISGYFCEEMGDGGTQCYPSIWAGGCSDGAEGSKTGGDSTAVTLTSATAEHIWGGVENSSNPEAISGSSTLILNDSAVTETVTCFDSITLNQPLHITAFLGKQDGVPTQLIDNGIKAGDIIVSCDDTDSDTGWFSLKDGELDYEVTDTQSIWRIKKVPGPDTDFEVHVDASTPDVKVSVNNSAQMAEQLLDDTDRQDISAGNTIGFHLRMKELEAVDDTLAEAVQNALAEDQVLALHLDINLFKIRNGAETQLSEASAPIRLTIQIPEKFREGLDDSEELVFSVIRVHEQEDGTLKTDILSDLDNDDSTITIETDKFSLYSLAYKKQAKSEGNHGGNGNGGGQDGSSSSTQNTSGGSANARAAKTGDTARQNEYGLLAAASLAALILLSRKKFK